VIRVVLFGICGRMGKIAMDEIQGQRDLTLVAGVERAGHPREGRKIGDIPVISDGDTLPESDVWLDFSLAGPAVTHARLAADQGKALVIGATGFSQAEEEEIHWQSKRCPIMVAPNLSAGVGALENVAVAATRLLPDGFEAIITELHHKTKKDSPSGTARRIADTMAKYGPRPEIHSIRAGGVVGEHRIHFLGAEEELILVHRAWSRRAFSSGIPKALRFIVQQMAGLYSHQDIYGLD